MTDDRRAVAALLLVTQSGLALLAALGLHTYVMLTRAMAQLALPELIAFSGPVVLLLLARGVFNHSRAATIAVFVWEGLMILGTGLSMLSEGPNALVLTAGLTGVALPAAIVYLAARPTSTGVKQPLTTGSLLATAFIHLTLVPEHLGEHAALGVSFLLDGVGLLVMAYLSARPGSGWRMPTAVLLAGTIVAYLVVVLRGQESVNDLGVATKFIELLALGLVVWPNRVSWRWAWPAPR